MDAKQRKERPLARGCLDYFPDALLEVAHVSFVGSQQHQPGEPMRWDKAKSPDHSDCLLRHLVDRGTTDTDGLLHTAKVAWRALALLQIELEAAKSEQKYLDTVSGVDESQFEQDRLDKPVYTHDRSKVEQKSKLTAAQIESLCDKPVAIHSTPYIKATITSEGVTYTSSFGDLVDNSDPHRYDYREANYPYPPGNDNCRNGKPDPRYQRIYVAGPMRGIKDFNFPAFDDARDHLIVHNWQVISPADMDRTLGQGTNRDYARRDTKAILECDAIYMLKGWEKSVGATAEHALATWAELTIFYQEEGK